MKHHEEATALLDRDETEETTQVIEPVTALQYTQLRLVAEGTAGLGNNSQAMFASTGTEVVWLDPTQDVLAENEVLIPASDAGKFPAISQVSVMAQWTPPAEGSTMIAGVVNVAQYEADALFWSDSAVHKFVVPYVASCSGSTASATLGQLQAAWNDYSTDSMAMFALMHRAPVPGQAVSLMDQLGFVQAVDTGDDQGAVSMTTLGACELKAEPVPPADPITTLFQPGHPAEPYPDYELLRAMAEWAASLVDGPWYFTLTPGMKELSPPTNYPPQLQPGEVMIPVHTPTTPSNRPAPLSVTIQPTGGAVQQLVDVADAAFWSTGSIQQFLLPYYASVRGMEAPAELQTIVNCWTLNETHHPILPPLFSAEEDSELEVYALVHLPMSAWMTEEEELATTLTERARDRLARFHARELEVKPRPRHSALRQVGIVHRHGGAVHLTTLEDFTVLHPQFAA
jgi:hypothetical protein